MMINADDKGRLEVRDTLYLSPSAYNIFHRLNKLIPKDGLGRNALEQYVARMVDTKAIRVGRELRLTPTMGYIAMTVSWTPPKEWKEWGLPADEWEMYIEEAHSRVLEELDAVRRMLIQLDFFSPVLGLLELALQEVNRAQEATAAS